MKRLFLAISLALLALPAAKAQGAGEIFMELNRVQTVENGCRITLLMQNGLEADIASFGFEVAVIDKTGLVGGLILVRSGQLRAGREQVKLFDLPGTECENIERLLVNNVVECEGEGLSPDLCQRASVATSRLDIRFE